MTLATMSSVTRLHLLSQSMLNVSCQKQKRCSSLPADSLTESPMEFVGELRPSGACSFLGVPGLSTSDLDLDLDDDEGEVVIGIRPKSSPLPRRKSSVSDEDSEPEPSLCGSRRVSFADAKGLSLVQVKEFDAWDVPKLPGYDSLESEGKDAEEYFLSLLTFCLPLSTEELFIKVQEQKVELETIELLPGTTILKGVIRVLNISFNKAVYIRTTLDSWSSHFDLLAEYIPGSSDNLTDCFSFRLTLVPPFGDQGARVEFCLRYETPVGTFWANNNNRNYVLYCHQRMNKRKERPQKENLNKKSCLKTVGQDFPTVENISAMEASSQENISTDLSKHGDKVDTMKAKQISDVQSGTSEEDGQLLAESRRNCSRRHRRKAARMALVRDIFAQRGGGTNDTERDESPPEAKQATQEESPEEKQSFSDGSDKSGGSQFDSVSLIHDVTHDTSPAHDCTSNSESEKLKSISLADSTTLTGRESATHLPDKPLHANDELAPAERQNINKSVSEAVESSQKQGVSYECTSNTAAEPADTVISAVSSESLVSKTDSFTFGTVVAPLYHQVFGRVGSERQSLGDPVRATLNVGNLNQIYPHTAGREIGCTAKTGARDNNDKVQRNVIKTREPDQECLHVTPNSAPIEEEETSLGVTENAETLQDPDLRCTNAPEVLKSISGDEVVHPHAKNITSTHVFSPQIPPESLHLQGETQEEDLTHDLRSKTTAETARTQLPEHTCTQIKTNLDETHAQNKTEEHMVGVETSFMSLIESKCVEESKKDDNRQTVSTNISGEDRLLEACHYLNNIINSATKGTENSYVSCFEAAEENNVTKHQISPETHGETNTVEEDNEEVNIWHKDETKCSAEIKVIGEVAESLPKAMMRHRHTHDMSVELKDEDTLKDEEIIVSGKNEHYKMKAAVANQEGFCLADTNEVKNWEMMVEEEEKNILTDDEESEPMCSKAENIEAVETDQEMEVTDTETASEDRRTTATEKDEMVGEITAAREEDAEDKQRIGEEQTEEIATGKKGEEAKKELEHVQATMREKMPAVEELCEGIKVEKSEEGEETKSEKAQKQEVNNKRINVQQEEEEKEMEEIEIDLDVDDEANVEWEDQVKPMEDKEKEHPDYKEEILVDETGESEIVVAESESLTIEDKENKARLDITQTKAEDGLSALVNNVQDKKVIEENTGEGQNAHIPAEMHLYKEEDFQSNEYVTHDLSKAARDESESTAAEGRSCIFPDDPKSDQLGHDSASAESDSDDEVELYMHCLRAVHTGPQPHKDHNKDTGFSVGKRPSISRSKLLSTPMPSISESLDEEPNLSLPQDMEAADFQPTALPVSSGEESIDRNVSWWMETFSRSNISKTLLYATLLVIFVVVAYHYDFLACFGLYLISVIWLCCHGETQPVKNNNRLN